VNAVMTQNDSPIVKTAITTPIGVLTLSATAQGLTGVYFEENRHGPSPEEIDGWRLLGDDSADSAAAEVLARAREQLEEYFAGHRRDFELPFAPRGTDFQQKVWLALREIPFGDVTSYSVIAERIGSPKAVRAVGAANGRNPLPVVVPCHRVVGANGDLTGFGGGIERKKWLLEHEQRVAAT
jgi:methylated-DNA-[protein]-cysteine S-methyltransferase